jgi:hypothetical protein
VALRIASDGGDDGLKPANNQKMEERFNAGGKSGCLDITLSPSIPAHTGRWR